LSSTPPTIGGAAWMRGLTAEVVWGGSVLRHTGQIGATRYSS
jgi:hypothetical protein